MAESDLIRGNVDTIILKVLYDGDRYGYDLIRQINARGDGQWEIKQPTVYACLKRLEKQGFVTSYWDSAESEGGRRKYYSLTDSGREVFLKYKNEFERASSLFGGLIFDSEPTVFIHPTDDFSDVEDEGYTLPKRKPKRTPKKPKAEAEPQDEQPEPEPIPEPMPDPEPEPKITEQEQPTVDDDIYPDTQPIQATEPEPEPEPQPEQQTVAREALDPKQIIERLFAAENGESYSDIQRKRTFAPIDDQPAPAPKPAVQKAPPAPVVQRPVQPTPAPTTAPAPAPAQPTLPQPTAERPMLVPAAIKGFEPAPVEKNPVGFATEEESPARREYRAVLGDLVDRFEVTSPDIRTTRTAAAQEQAATAEQTAGQLGKVEQAVRELGNDVKIRNHNNSAQEYAEKNFYYSNRLMMTHYTGMCLAMFLIGLVLFLTFYVGLNMRMQYDYVLYICAGLLPIFMFITAVICYANNPEKTRRINVNFKFSLIIRIVIMIQVAVVIYCVNLICGMPLAFSTYYIPSIVLPLAYSLFIPISEIIFINLLNSGKYSDSRQ
ncbi:MAG: helix-turn-helix transcriptional regulator [Clostridiales bacterium]|nr:helix-turn-helix transcriptional regulator [Clostridiales bacterium]